MSLKLRLLGCAAAPLACLILHPAFAQDAALDTQIEAMRQQIQQQQQQMQLQQQQMQQQQQQLQTLLDRVGKSETQAKQAQDAATAAQQTAASKSSIALDSHNRPTWTSADGQNSISLTSIFNFDVGGYRYKADPGATTQTLNDGVNARRARIGVHGLFLGDWVYDLQYDFGNYDDNLTDTNAPKSGVKTAYVSYTGIKSIAIDFGYLPVPYTLDEATANTDYMFMEHPLPEALAIAVAGGDSRSTLGTRYYTDRFWAGLNFTGPKAGTSHTTREQLGGTARMTYQVVQDGDTSLHVGADVEQLFKSPGSGTLNFTTEPELSIDPTAIAGLTLGSTTNPLEDMSVYSLEAAGGWHSLFFQSEYFLFLSKSSGLETATFNGGYLQGSWTLTGEHREYRPESASYARINPAHPFSPKTGGWGAWEVAARVDYTDLNSNFTPLVKNSSSAVDGGQDVMATVGLNWYANQNVMFKLNYLHGVFSQLWTNITSTPSSQKLAGAHFDALAMRMQVTF